MDSGLFSVEQAQPADITAIAAIFTDSFRESVLHYCDRLPQPLAMEDVFTLVYEAEATAALVARDSAGTVVAYCFAPVALSSLWSRAIWGGHLLKWLWRWLRGRYGLGLHPVKVLFLNKVAFLRSSLAPTQAADARILSIAVATAWRGRGVAGALMTAAESYFASHQVRRIRLEVRPDNEPAVRLYQRHGYISAGTTYDSQGPWLIMFKDLQERSAPTYKSERCAKS